MHVWEICLLLTQGMIQVYSCHKLYSGPSSWINCLLLNPHNKSQLDVYKQMGLGIEDKRIQELWDV